MKEKNGKPAGKFEWFPASAETYVSSGVVAEIETPELDSRITCRTGNGEGEILGATTGVNAFAFEECTTDEATEKCGSPTASTGSITTDALDTTLRFCTTGRPNSALIASMAAEWWPML